jgi:hypothetical protein
MVLVFAASMSFISLGVYNLQWGWALIGVGFLVVFVALGGVLVPSGRAAIPEQDKDTANWLMQFFGATCATLFFVMALVSWVVGNRTLSSNNWYQVLGLLIFLGLAGLGITGMAATGFMLAVAANKQIIARRAAGAVTTHG